MSQNTNDIREVKSDGNVLSTSESNAASAWKETEAKAGDTENDPGTFTEEKSVPTGLEEQSNEEIINTPASQESEMIGTGPEDPQKEREMSFFSRTKRPSTRTSIMESISSVKEVCFSPPLSRSFS